MTLLELSEIVKRETGKDFFNEDVHNDILYYNPDNFAGIGSVRYDNIENWELYYIEFVYNPEDVDYDDLLNLEIKIVEEIKEI
jgi:hypothetical protein